MEIDEDSFAELFVEVVREFGRAAARREAAQRAVECVVEKVGRFNGAMSHLICKPTTRK